MLPQYKLALVEKLCEDVLGTAAEGGLPLDGCCHSVIADALGVIALPDLQITAKTVAGGDDGDGDDGGEGGTQGGASQVRTPHRILYNAGHGVYVYSTITLCTCSKGMSPVDTGAAGMECCRVYSWGTCDARSNTR